MPSARSRTILIVDDSEDVRTSLELLLRIFGFDVATAANGREAIDYLYAHDPPRLILLDLRMPVMDGVTFRQRQLADPALAAIPVVACSGENDLAERDDLGGIPTWAKGANPLALVRMVAERCR